MRVEKREMVRERESVCVCVRERERDERERNGGKREVIKGKKGTLDQQPQLQKKIKGRT